MTGKTTILGEILSLVLGRKAPAEHGARVSETPGGDQIVRGVEGREIDDAIEAARETLGVFWAWHETRLQDPDCCALKVRVPTDRGGGEHLWFIDILRTGNLVTGMVASEPVSARGLKPWQPAVIDMDQVTDWTFRIDGLYYGHFTTRVLDAAHPEVAARASDLSAMPLPDDLTRH
jgi:uncharacterized protein YegJ (DUF2314 family)